MMSKDYAPQHLEKWYETINFTGDSFEGYYVGAWRLFRASPVERSNFNYIRAHLEDCGDPVEVVTFTDEVYSYRYYVLIPPSSIRALKMADMFARRLLKTESLDPDGEHLEDLKSAKSTWTRSGLRARIRMCADAGISIFAARSQSFPAGVNGLRIFQSLNEGVPDDDE